MLIVNCFSQVDEVTELVKGNSAIKSLMLRSTGLNDSDLEKLALTLSGSDLKYLNLNCNQISAAGIPHLRTILRNCSSLESLA